MSGRNAKRLRKRLFSSRAPWSLAEYMASHSRPRDRRFWRRAWNWYRQNTQWRGPSTTTSSPEKK